MSTSHEYAEYDSQDAHKLLLPQREAYIRQSAETKNNKVPQFKLDEDEKKEDK